MTDVVEQVLHDKQFFADMVAKRPSMAVTMARRFHEEGWGQGLENPVVLTPTELLERLWLSYEQQRQSPDAETDTMKQYIARIRGRMSQKRREWSKEPVPFPDGTILRVIWDCIQANPLVWGLEDRVRQRMADLGLDEQTVQVQARAGLSYGFMFHRFWVFRQKLRERGWDLITTGEGQDARYALVRSADVK